MSVAEHNLEPPTLSEVVRLINGLTNRIDEAMKGVVTRHEYTSDRAGMDLKFNRSEEIHVELKTLIVEVRAEASKNAAEARSEAAKESAEVRTESADRVRTLESRFEAYVAMQAERKSKTNFLLGGAALTAITSLVIAVFNRVMIGG